MYELGRAEAFTWAQENGFLSSREVRHFLQLQRARNGTFAGAPVRQPHALGVGAGASAPLGSGGGGSVAPQQPQQPHAPLPAVVAQPQQPAAPQPQQPAAAAAVGAPLPVATVAFRRARLL
jgi:hypothetical protein